MTPSKAASEAAKRISAKILEYEALCRWTPDDVIALIIDEAMRPEREAAANLAEAATRYTSPDIKLGRTSGMRELQSLYQAISAYRAAIRPTITAKDAEDKA